MIRFDSDAAYIRHSIIRYLRQIDRSHLGDRFLEGIERGRMDYTQTESYYGGVSGHTLTFWIPLECYEGEDEEGYERAIRHGFIRMHEAERVDGLNVLFRIVPDDVPAAESGLNNCFFKTERTITHDELRFRSRSEIAIYDELKRRQVLFFPNAAAVLGRREPDQPEKREPDFLVCHRGRWGILEVSGEPYHVGAISAAKDHDRSRLFQAYGLMFIQHYDSGRCVSDPAGVVDNFLSLLSQIKA